jgi:hypothetical protein
MRQKKILVYSLPQEYRASELLPFNIQNHRTTEVNTTFNFLTPPASRQATQTGKGAGTGNRILFSDTYYLNVPFAGFTRLSFTTSDHLILGATHDWRIVHKLGLSRILLKINYITYIIKGIYIYGGLGSKFLNEGQNFTIDAEKITEYYCYWRLRQLIIEEKCKPPRQSRLISNLAPATPSH